MWGTIILATGFQVFDAHRSPEFGYGVYPNVYTALEIERLVNASGPTSGEVVLRDGKRPKSVAIIHCVGSRDEKTNRWCSRVCCMYSLKLAHLLKEHTDAEIFNFYIDIRTPGKGFEEFYQKLRNEGVHFIRGKVAEVTDWAFDPSEEGKLSSGWKTRCLASPGAFPWTWWCWPRAWSRTQMPRKSAAGST